MGEMRERMLRGELYIADDPENGTFVNVDAVMLDVAPITIGAWAGSTGADQDRRQRVAARPA
jgi:hypothetical protein